MNDTTPPNPTGKSSMNMIELKQVSKQYGNVQALAPVDLTVREGEFVTLLGPSGSGKTTLLNLIAGMIAPTTGQVFIQGQDVTQCPPSQRKLGMVFQNYALMPHMTVFENIAFPLRVRHMAKDEIAHKVAEVLKLVRLPDIASRKPRELSGGQQQRVSLARCIVYNPALILLDEPLGALDKKLREHMQLEIRRVHAELGITMLNVTHDQDEALTMSDRIVLMNDGRIEQIAEPETLYFLPRTVFAADFIGTANLIAGKIQQKAGDHLKISTELGQLDALAGPDSVAATLPTDAPVMLLLRPENVHMSTAGEQIDGEASRFEGVIEDSIILGGLVRHHVRLTPNVQMIVQKQNHRACSALTRGTRVHLHWDEQDCQVLAAR